MARKIISWSLISIVTMLIAIIGLTLTSTILNKLTGNCMNHCYVTPECQKEYYTYYLIITGIIITLLIINTTTRNKEDGKR